MLSVKVSDPIGSMNIIPGFPRVVFNSKVLPFHQVSKFSVDDLTVQNFLNYPFFFTFNDLWEWWRWKASPFNRVSWGWGEFDYIEDRMEALHGYGQLESVGTISNSFFNQERA
jgi:hypothetical protein